MQGRFPARLQLKKIAWIFIGLCFVVLYSCPVRKFLILRLDKMAKPETTASQFVSHGSSHSPKIVSFNRNNTRYMTLGPVAKASAPIVPWIPAIVSLLAALLALYDLRLRSGQDSTANPLHGFIPPRRYLQLLRLRL